MCKFPSIFLIHLHRTHEYNSVRLPSLKSHFFFSRALGIDFVMCKLQRFIVKACPSDSICLILPILGTGEKHWPCCQLLRGLFLSRSWLCGLYTASPCTLVSAILPAGRDKLNLPVLFSVIMLGKASWTRETCLRDVWGASYFVWVLRGSKSSFWWSSQPCFLHSQAFCWWRNWEVTPQTKYSSWSFGNFFFLFAFTHN